MFSTSDIYNLKFIAEKRGFLWKENLLGGIVVHGRQQPSHQAAANFLISATEQCNISQYIKYAGYDVPGIWRTRSITPKSFLRLARGELSGAKNASGVLLRGEFAAEGSQHGLLLFGGTSSCGPIESGAAQDRGASSELMTEAFSADFIFPLGVQPRELAESLLRLSVEYTGADYGYYFIRDNFCLPTGYAYGGAAPLDYSAEASLEDMELHTWGRFSSGPGLWAGRPWMRDLYEVNLMSPRHASELVPGLGLLPDWITAEPGRGCISDAGQGRWLWTLTDAEMVAVRPVLNAAGLLVYCIDRVYRDLPGGGRSAAVV